MGLLELKSTLEKKTESFDLATLEGFSDPHFKNLLKEQLKKETLLIKSVDGPMFKTVSAGKEQNLCFNAVAVDKILGIEESNLSFSCSMEDQTLEVVMTLTPLGDWGLGEGFWALSGYPFNVLRLTQSRLILSTKDMDEFQYEWGDENSYKETISLSKGLNYAGILGLGEDNPELSFLTLMIEVGGTFPIFYGTIDNSVVDKKGIYSPDVSLKCPFGAELASSKFKEGLPSCIKDFLKGLSLKINITNPKNLSSKDKEALEDNSPSYVFPETQFYLDIEVEGYEVWIDIPPMNMWSTLSVLSLYMQGKGGRVITLESMAKNIGKFLPGNSSGTISSDISVLPEPLRVLARGIGLKQVHLSFFPRSGAISDVSFIVSTTEDLPLLFGAIKLSLSMKYTILNPISSPSSDSSGPSTFQEFHGSGCIMDDGDEVPGRGGDKVRLSEPWKTLSGILRTEGHRPATMDLDLFVEEREKEKILIVQGEYDVMLQLSKLIGKPSPLADVGLGDFWFRVAQGKEYSFGASADVKVDIDGFPLGLENVDVSIFGGEGSHRIAVQGTIEIGKFFVDVFSSYQSTSIPGSSDGGSSKEREKNSSTWEFKGSTSSVISLSSLVGSLAKDFGFGEISVPDVELDGFDISLILGETKSLTFSTTINGVAHTLFKCEQVQEEGGSKPKWQYVMGLFCELDFAFSDHIALFNSKNDIKLKTLYATYGVLNKQGESIPYKDPLTGDENTTLKKAVDFGMSVDIGGVSTPLQSQSSVEPKPTPEPHSVSPSIIPSTKEEQPSSSRKKEISPSPEGGDTATGSDLVKKAPPLPGQWISVQKSLGPITLDKIGLNYKDRQIKILLNGGLNSKALKLDLLGFSIGIPISGDDFTPSLGLSGLSVGFDGGGVSISGGLLRVQEKDKADVYNGELLRVQEKDKVDVYNGELSLKAGPFGLTAFGSYTTTSSGAASLFAYVLADYPFGGPPVFFVDGIAAGLGYNRDLTLPAIEGVKDFCLVKPVLNPGSGSDFATLNTDIPVLPESYWIAAGVKFNSFKMVDGFALIAIKFGVDFEFSLLGLAQAYFPSKEAPLSFVELGIKAVFAPNKGVVSVEAALSNRSYIFSTDCHLTGGFAFYTWFDPSVHAGDFVITLGGYHPSFKKPDHYPNVPRLGMNWTIGSTLSIKGELYFALTPVCIMAGGRLAAVFKSGVITAGFDLYANILIAWKPFHYELTAGVRIYVDVNAKVLFVRVHINIEIGADLEVWGPDFSGIAHVNLTLISFDIPFGNASRNSNQKISWEEFKTSFLPAPENICQMTVAEGLLNACKDDDTLDGIIDPQHFKINMQSQIPMKEFNPGDALWEEKRTTLDDTRTDLGVGLVQLDDNKFKSRGTISIRRDDKLLSKEELERIDIKLIHQAVPKSLWKNLGKVGTDKIGGDSTVLGTVGVSLVPSQQTPSSTVRVGGALLKAPSFGFPNISKGETPYMVGYTTPILKASGEGRNLDKIKQTIKTDASDLVESFKGLLPEFKTDTETLKSRLNNYFENTPYVCSLGDKTTMEAA